MSRSAMEVSRRVASQVGTQTGARQMATLLVGRSVAAAAVVAIAIGGSPFLGSAQAAPFAATGITTQPAPDSNKVVPANRPTVKASFSANLADTSTITLTVKGQ